MHIIDETADFDKISWDFIQTFKQFFIVAANHNDLKTFQGFDDFLDRTDAKRAGGNQHREQIFFKSHFFLQSGFIEDL